MATPMERLHLLRQEEGNKLCVDCGDASKFIASNQSLEFTRYSYVGAVCIILLFFSTDTSTCNPPLLHADPEWCCLNRGVFVCITCAGIHRRLHSSKVRSCRLDTWKDSMVDVSAEYSIVTE